MFVAYLMKNNKFIQQLILICGKPLNSKLGTFFAGFAQTMSYYFPPLNSYFNYHDQTFYWETA